MAKNIDTANKIEILKELIPIAEKCGEVTDIGVYETWLYIVAKTDDGTKVRFDVNFNKEKKEDGN